MDNDLICNKIYNEKCEDVIKRLPNGVVNVILTSPPYNTSNRTIGGNSVTTLLNNHVDSKFYPHSRYDIFLDNKTQEEYIDWTIELFNSFDRILAPNGVILYNISYSADNRDTMFLTVADIVRKTNFGIADCIAWKKRSALPNNISPNKLTRIFEPVFVFARKDEMATFQCNKKVVSHVERTNQALYENIYNFIEADNNDGVCTLNRATYSTQLCRWLLGIYGKEGNVVFDPFNGSGTTSVATVQMGMKYIGCEISKAQCEYAEKRINETCYGIREVNGVVEQQESLF